MSSTWLEWRWMRAAKLAQRSVRNTRGLEDEHSDEEGEDD